jgi:protease II
MLIYFQDFEACITGIHEQGYSSPHLTAVIGTSAGGLPVAVLCNHAPYLVKAAVLKVCNNDRKLTDTLLCCVVLCCVALRCVVF